MAETYFQFPISALSWDPVRNWGTILDLACHHCGAEMLEKLPLADCTAKAQSWVDSHPNVQAGIGGRRDQFALALGYQMLGVMQQRGSLCDTMKRVEKLRDHCACFPYPTVRIRTDFWWKTFTPKDYPDFISHREFVVLCAVYAAIGNKPFAKASLQMLRRYAAGYPREDQFQSALSEKRHSSIFLSIHQLRDTLDALEANGFFAKFTFNRGECFYSNKMTREQVRQCVGDRKLRKFETLAVNRSLDRMASEDILRRKAALKAAHSTEQPTET